MTSFVLDNSVAMRWCFEDTNLYAEGAFAQLLAGVEVFVPVLWRYEAVAVLTKAQRHGSLDTPRAKQFLEDFGSYRITVDREGIDRIFSDVHHLASRYRLSAYDAAYLELAQRRQLPLATLDEELIRACKESGVRLWEPDSPWGSLSHA